MESRTMMRSAVAVAVVSLFAGCSTWGGMDRQEKGTAVGARVPGSSRPADTLMSKCHGKGTLLGFCPVQTSRQPTAQPHAALGRRLVQLASRLVSTSRLSRFSS